MGRKGKGKERREREGKGKEGKGQEREGRGLQWRDKQEAKKPIRGDGWMDILFLSVGVVGSVLESYFFLCCLPAAMAFLLVFSPHQPFCQIQLCGKLACRVGQDAAVA